MQKDVFLLSNNVLKMYLFIWQITIFSLIDIVTWLSPVLSNRLWIIPPQLTFWSFSQQKSCTNIPNTACFFLVVCCFFVYLC